MPKFDFSIDEQATPSTGSLYSIPDGWYVLKVTGMANGVTSWGDQQVDLTWDVAEGPEKDKCAENNWSEYAHVIHLPLSGRSAGFTKHVLHMLTDSNPGFKAGEAFVKDDYLAFNDKVFGARLANEDSNKVNPKTGKPYRNTNVKEVVLAEEARERAGSSAADGTQAAPVADVFDDDIPF